MTIQPGDRMPDVPVRRMGEAGVEIVSTAELFAGRRSVLFGVPGAFTPACSDVHLPGFLLRRDELREQGVELVACTAVNDAFVMSAWARARGVGDRVMMLADGNGELAAALGLELDASGFGMGTRSKRFAAVVDDGVVGLVNVEPAGGVGVSSAAAVLAGLRGEG